MSKQVYKIPVEWSVCETLKIEADSLEEAVKYVEDNMNEIPLGTDPDYIDGSYAINGADEYKGPELVQYIKDYYNPEA